MTQSENRIPSLMQIMTAAAKAANLTICDLMGTERFTNVINARAAFYKIAADYGYPKHDIMECIDRNRTVGYNYDANVNGHLKKDRRFLALCARTAEQLTKYTHRVYETPQQREKRQNLMASQITQSTSNVALDKSRQKPPVFKDHKSPLGWFFTADEMRRMYYACREAEEWFEKTYLGKQPQLPEPGKPTRKVPTEMNTQEAAIYLDISVGLLVKGVQLGQLIRWKKPGDSRYWYHTSELDRYRERLANTRKKR